jgi:hypothetical protein
VQPRLDGSVIVVIDERRNPLCKLRCRYPGYFIVKRVTNAGTFRFKKRLLFIANALIHHPIGLEEIEDGVWSIFFCHVLLGRLDERDYVLRGLRSAWKN